MARDTCRPGDDLQPWTPRRSKSGVDELDFKKPNSFSSRIDTKMELETPLSPIEEEGQSEPSIAPLQVKLTLRFLDPVVRSVFNRTYSSSQFLVPTDRLCRGLLRRIEHCGEELITRKDSAALNSTQCLLKGPKDLRFELCFQIYRKDHSGAWAERALRSYQKQPLTSASAMDILRSTHNIIGIFFKRHDDHFQWIDEPSQEYFPEKPATFKPSLTGPLDLACVPRSRFIESTQRWEALPGYTLEITLESKDSSRPHSDIKRIIKVDSTQTAPLNLSLAEDILWQAYRAVEEALDSRKHAFDTEHASCEAVDGVPDCGCQHFVQDALRVDLRSVNNLGPTYEHLCRNIQSRLRLFKHPTGQDCDEFVNLARICFQELRDRTDEKLNMLNDFDFRIAELIGHGWRVKNPARFIIDGKQSYTRRSIEALLDRIRTGVGDVLRGHDVAVRMIAYKRGHLILDKALISRNHREKPDTTTSKVFGDEQGMFIARLKTRIQEDIDMICKDTCSLEDIPESASEHEHEHLLRLHTTRSHHFKPRSMASQGSLYTLSGSPGIFTEPPVPPCVPTRKSSRVFPLVPGRYKDEERPSSATTSSRDSSIEMGSGSSCRASSRAHSLEPPAGARRLEDHRGDALCGEEYFGLRPAAELRRARDMPDDSSSSILTYSSLPALTESETPSPGQSMLTTPECLRKPSSQPGGLPCSKDTDSKPLKMVTSIASLAESLMEPKPLGISFVRPRTPLNEGAPDAASPSTPRPTRGSIFADDSAVTRASRKIREAYQGGIETQLVMTGDLTIGSVLDDVTASDLKATGVDITDLVSTESTEDFPTEGWLLHCEEDTDEEALALLSCGETSDLVDVDHSGSAEALRPILEETVTKEENSNSDVSEQLAQVDSDHAKAVARPLSEPVDQQAVAELSRDEDDTQSTESTEALESTEQDGPSKDIVEDESAYRNNITILPSEDEVLQSEIDCFEEDNNSDEPETEISATTEPDLRPVGVFEVSEMSEMSESGHSVPFSDSVPNVQQGSETTEAARSEKEEHMVLESESESEARSDASGNVLSGSESCATEPEVISEVLDAMKADYGDPGTTSGSSDLSIDHPDDLSDPSSQDTVSVEDQVIASVRVFPPETGPFSEVTHSPRPSSTRSGLGSDFLQPLPVSSKSGARTRPSRSSFSSCSEWEDCVSEPRQSIDSVDTFRLPPLSEEDDELQRPESPIRLGKPTAGFLGLRESRWAGFGIRGALTGTHVFDRASATSTPQISQHKAHNEHQGPRDNEPAASVRLLHVRPSASHRKMIHLSHKKSNSSVFFPDPHVKSTKLSKKETKELKASETITPKGGGTESNPDEGAGRFPRAMLLVAGLAIVSSVVNRNSA